MSDAPGNAPAPRSWREAWREPEFRALALASAVAYFARLWEGTLDGDPVVYASIAKGIAESGNWLDLELGGEPYWNKPPLAFWLTAALFQVFGTSTFAACFWSALFGAAACLALHRFAREAFGRPTAFYATLAMLLTPELLRYASRFRLESICVFFTILTVHDVWRAVSRSDPAPLRRVGLWISCLFLAKGGPGFIALAIVAVYLGWSRAGGLLLSRSGLQGLVGLLLLSLFWPLLQWLRHGDPWLAQAIGIELLQVDTVGIPSQNPLTFYLWRLVRTNSVWFVLGLLGARSVWQERKQHPDLWRLLATWLVLSAVLISLPERIFGRYLTALYPLLALLSGAWLAPRLDPGLFTRLVAWLPKATAVAAFVVLCLPLPIHNDEAVSVRKLDAVLRALAPDAPAVPAYGEVHGFVRGEFHFHIGRNVDRFADREALERAAPPLVVARGAAGRELRAAGWRRILAGWHWVAYLSPLPSDQVRTSPPIPPDSRRLQ